MFELDEEDLNQWDNPDLWEKASPIQMGFPEGRKTLMEECQKAKDLGGSKVSEFQSKMLNMWVDDGGASSYISLEDLRKCKLKEPYIYYGYPPSNQQLSRGENLKKWVFAAVIVNNSVNSVN